MLYFETIGPRAVRIRAEARIEADQVAPALDRMLEYHETLGHYDVLAEVAWPLDIDWIDVIAAELRRTPDLARIVGAIDRVAVVADPTWIRVAARIEGALLPGIAYRSFRPDEITVARAWVLRAKKADT